MRAQLSFNKNKCVQVAGISTSLNLVAGLHRASPSATLDSTIKLKMIIVSIGDSVNRFFEFLFRILFFPFFQRPIQFFQLIQVVYNTLRGRIHLFKLIFSSQQIAFFI